VTAPGAGLRRVADDEDDAYDLVFVGAGVSTAYTLLGLFESLAADPPPSPLRIAIVEKTRDVFCGVPYGGRAARTALLITALRDFLPEGERKLFADWLAVNKTWVFEDFLTHAGPAAGRWWARHRAAVAENDFDSLFLPRYAFGAYMVRRVRRVMARADADGLARTRVIADEAVSLEPTPGGYVVAGRCGTITGRRVVLAIGSSPTLARLRSSDGPAPTAVLVDRPFDENGMAVDRIADGLRGRTGSRVPHVVVIGANASTMDLLFQFDDLRSAEAHRAVFTVISLQGRLPDRMPRTPGPATFVAACLARLDTVDFVSAAAIYEAALADIDRGRQAGLTAAQTLAPISTALGRVLPRLDEAEALEFAGRWGVELGRHQRRAGWEYSEVVENLRADGRLRVVSGVFLGVEPAPSGGVHVRYSEDGGVRTLPMAADVVINCAGPPRDLRTGAPALLDGLLRSGVCRVTPSGVGIAVDSSFAAAPGLHVMGPLIAGNTVHGGPIWHMEHCGRISSYGAAVGADLARLVMADAAQSRRDH
jgi:uncharacterized NAD(P)/FAD-binding protein YdhS